MRVKFGNGTKDVPIIEVNAANYIVPQGEEGAYHVRQEITAFDPKTGKRLSQPRIQKYGPKEYKQIERILRQQGYEITVLHDPTDFLKKQEEELEALRNMTAEKKKELEQKRYEEEKAKMKAEILKELKESGVIPSKEEKPEEKPAKDGSKKK